VCVCVCVCVRVCACVRGPNKGEAIDTGRPRKPKFRCVITATCLEECIHTYTVSGLETLEFCFCPEETHVRMGDFCPLLAHGVVVRSDAHTCMQTNA
jgi:hypothetical protein